MCHGALFSVGTQAGQIAETEDTTHVPIPTERTVTTESTIVPRTVADLGSGVDVQERTLLVVTGAEFGVEIALGHFGHIVLVQKLAVVTLFAQTTQPVFAHNSPVTAEMTKRTHVTPGAGTGGEEVTHARHRLVHAGEGERLSSQLLFQSHFHVERELIHVSHQNLHLLRLKTDLSHSNHQ